MQINREDVVQAALIVERWCVKQINDKGECNCPFADGVGCILQYAPVAWSLEEFLRTRGLKDE